MKYLLFFRKQIIMALTLVVALPIAHAQLVSGGAGSASYNNFKNIDFVVMFNGINNQSQLNYNGAFNTISWSTYEQPNVVVSNQQFHYNIDDNKGYILRVDDKTYHIWVIDYAQHLPAITALNVVADPQTRCRELALNIVGNVPQLSYRNRNGGLDFIDRNFTLKYKTLEWNDKAWKEVERSSALLLPQTNIFIDESPLCDTQFMLEGDQFATDLGIPPFTISSGTFAAVAVAGKITTIATTRDAQNEGDRPDKADVVSGSAPLDILFKANGNVPVARNFAWTISKSGVVLINRAVEEHRYTFSEAGIYKVKLTVMNEFCSFSDSINITIVESGLQVPDIFTPNGDGVNDEFRVAYKSLKSFNGVIYSRWGRKVFQWTDPAKGWDGNINGRPAAEGGYFYVISAEGTDGQKYYKKGDITLLRGKN
jgi:gliding motility-associated-like protein